MRKQLMLKLCLLLIFTAFVSCVSSGKKLLSNDIIKGVDAQTWVEFKLPPFKESTSLFIAGGEYKIGVGEWMNTATVIPPKTLLTVRIKSSIYPSDVTMGYLKYGSDSIFLSTLTKNFPVNPTNADGSRNVNLGISGPVMDSIGGPGKKWWDYNFGPNERRGSVIHEGLLPDVKPLFYAQIRDPVICLGGDGNYYLTGSTGADIWHFNDGVELWKSPDLKNWEYMGLVWSFEKDGTWEKAWRFHRTAVRALWAPEINYIKGNYYITHSMPPGGRGLLKSATGKPEGPYVNALANDGYWEDDIDGSLFEDEDGSVYYLYGGGWIAKMKDDMSGFAEEPVKPVLIDPDLNPDHHAPSCSTRRDCQDIGHEGASMIKRNGLYYLNVADTYQGRYSSMVAVSESIYGPYRLRHEAVPCGGGTRFFQDKDGQWWCPMFGNDAQAPFRELPAIVKIGFDEQGKVVVLF